MASLFQTRQSNLNASLPRRRVVRPSLHRFALWFHDEDSHKEGAHRNREVDVAHLHPRDRLHAGVRAHRALHSGRRDLRGHYVDDEVVLRTYKLCCHPKDRVGRLRHCLAHSCAPATAPLPRRRASIPKSSASRRSCPLAPSRARRPPPSAPRTPRRPCAEKQNRAKPLEALRAARTTPPLDPKTARTPLRPPRSVRHGVRPAARCRIRPVPFFRLRRLSELGSPVPAPAPFALRHPFATPPLVGFAPSRPQHPAHHVIASRRCLSCPSYSPRAPPLFRLPAASSRFPLTHPAPARLPYERPLTFFARAVLHEHQEKACQQRTSEPSLRMRLRRTRSKKKGSVSAPPPRMTRVSVQPQRVNPASPSVRSVPTPLHPTASRQRPP